MQISVNIDAKHDVVVALEGEFDAQGCKQVRSDLEGAAKQCAQSTLLLDLKNVSFIDSSGIGAIVFLFRRVIAVEGNLKLINVCGQPKELISLLRVDEAIPVIWLNEAS